MQESQAQPHFWEKTYCPKKVTFNNEIKNQWKMEQLIFLFQLVTEEKKRRERERERTKNCCHKQQENTRELLLWQRGQLTNNLFWKRKIIVNLIPCLARAALSSIITWPSHIDTQSKDVAINWYYLIVLYFTNYARWITETILSK